MEPDTQVKRAAGPKLSERRPLDNEPAEISSLLEATLECPICKQLFEDPIICACCNSTFCGSCLPNGTHLAATLGADREGHSPRLLRNETVRRAVACLPRYCKFAFVAETATNSWKRIEEGCPYVGTESDVKTHEEVCEFRPVRCPHCELEMAERDRNGHQADCRQNCSFCGEMILYAEFSAHYAEVCPNAAVTCPKPGCTYSARPGDTLSMSRHAQLCRPPPVELLPALPLEAFGAATLEERPAPAFVQFSQPNEVKDSRTNFNEKGPEGFLEGPGDSADGSGETGRKDGTVSAEAEHVPVLGCRGNQRPRNAVVLQMTWEAPNSRYAPLPSREVRSGGSGGSGNTMLNSCPTAKLGAPVDMMNARLPSEAGLDGLGRSIGAKEGSSEEDTAPETGDAPSETEATVQEDGNQASEDGSVNQGEDQLVWGGCESVLGEGDKVSKDLGKRVPGKRAISKEGGTGPVGEKVAPGEGERVLWKGEPFLGEGAAFPGRGQTGPGEKEPVPGEGDVVLWEGEEAPEAGKELVLSLSDDSPPELLDDQDLTLVAMNLLLRGHESWSEADALVRRHDLASHLETLVRVTVVLSGPESLRAVMLNAGRLTNDEGTNAFLLSLGRLRCGILRVILFILRGEAGNDIRSKKLRIEALWAEILREFGFSADAQNGLLEELQSINSKTVGRATKGKPKQSSTRASGCDSGAEEVVTLALNERQKTNAVRKLLLGVVEGLKREDCADEFWVTPTEEQEPGYSTVIKRPMCLRDVTDSIRQQSDYRLQDLEADMELIVQNAHKYCHIEYPSIVDDADRLNEIFQTKLDEVREDITRLEV